MGKCCGGKNAGKPITYPRYLAGLSVFCAYHSGVNLLLRAAAKPFPELSKIRDFQTKVFRDELKEVLRQETINVGGLLRPSAADPSCEVGIEVFPIPTTAQASSGS